MERFTFLTFNYEDININKIEKDCQMEDVNFATMSIRPHESRKLHGDCICFERPGEGEITL